ncbi:hypothetical protein [Sphingomonas prati]|uniref:Uncharacterized protein n=1 Tax=Sphingomonas prati TaxID=1843237 RepID=A0A7W9F1Z3_9SPHN|nr:hypothetical protein [Sphingomonas prati]MBB5728269.1 hypothetical protein [Sphingomonas prati]GGE75120.1 hypothetical protein GCM10011404_04600 [Sphingomonas prati]
MTISKKHAVALQQITHGDDAFAQSAVIIGMHAGQFGDWEMAGLVREATATEVAAAKGEKTVARKPRKRSPSKTPAAQTPSV